MSHLVFFLVMVSATIFSQAAMAEDIQVTLGPNKTSTGNMIYALYDSADSFLNETAPYQGGSVPAVEGSQEITLTGVTPGVYAFTAFQDLNGNGQLDKNFLGMPTEPFGISEITKTLWSQPQWDQVQFTVAPGVVTDLQILMKMQ